jgi:hypothetical protein
MTECIFQRTLETRIETIIFLYILSIIRYAEKFSNKWS